MPLPPCAATGSGRSYGEVEFGRKRSDGSLWQNLPWLMDLLQSCCRPAAVPAGTPARVQTQGPQPSQSRIVRAVPLGPRDDQPATTRILGQVVRTAAGPVWRCSGLLFFLRRQIRAERVDVSDERRAVDDSACRIIVALVAERAGFDPSTAIVQVAQHRLHLGDQFG